jgi:ABC-type multidrug transport system permease subunit
VAIALLLFTGVALLIGDQPWWVRWPAFLVSAAVTAGIQVVALTLRRRRALAAPSTTDGPTPADGAR